jgi:acetolactate synthase-1/3 small subunit
VGDGSTSAVYLLVNEYERLDQIVKQLEKLYDVLKVSERQDCDRSIFSRLGELVGP